MHGRPQEYNIGAPPPPPEKSKIHIEVTSSIVDQVGAFFLCIEALFRLAPLTKNYVGVHGREQTRCGYCNKAIQIHGASNVMFVYALQKPETATYHIIIDVLNEGMLNDINNIFKCCT